VVVHFLYADPADVAVAGAWWSVDVAGHAEFDAADFEGIRHDVGDLDVAFYLFVAGDGQELALHLEAFVLRLGGRYYLLDDAWLGGGDPDEGVEIEELQCEQ
jgi:hypothetical protein